MERLRQFRKEFKSIQKAFRRIEEGLPPEERTFENIRERFLKEKAVLTQRKVPANHL